VTDEKKPFSIVPPVEEVTSEEPSFVDEVQPELSDESEPDIKTPLERLIQKELKTDRFLVAFYDEDGNVGFHIGDGMQPENVSFVTDLIKAQVMMQLLLE
jgi:hypothetical protein